MYQLYMKDVYCYLLSLCYDHHAAEDLMQETFYRAYLYLEDCKEEKVKPWLFRVAYNAFVNYKRKEHRSSVKEPDYFRHYSHSITPEEVVLRQERWSEMMRWLDTIPDKQRHALQLYDFGQLTYEEAAETMGVSLSHFKVLLFRARQRLRDTQRKEGRR
jgi:RNA polymerase sigma-70 factor (ECF subfamily)